MSCGQSRIHLLCSLILYLKISIGKMISLVEFIHKEASIAPFLQKETTAIGTLAPVLLFAGAYGLGASLSVGYIT